MIWILQEKRTESSKLMDERIKVAILDDCVSMKRIFSEKLLEDKRMEVRHGSLVVATIEKYSKANKIYFLYDIYNVKNQGEAILDALRQCIVCGIDVVVMSFTFESVQYRVSIENMLRKLNKKGCKIIASDYNRGGNIGYPARSRYVIGVGKDYSSFKQLGKVGIQCTADVKPEFVHCVNDYYLFSGTSKATAIITAKIIDGGQIIDNLIMEDVDCIQRQNVKIEIGEIYESMYSYFGVRLEDNLFEILKSKEEIEYIILSILKKYNIEQRCIEMKYDNLKSIRDIFMFINNCYEKMESNI